MNSIEELDLHRHSADTEDTDLENVAWLYRATYPSLQTMLVVEISWHVSF